MDTFQILMKKRIIQTAKCLKFLVGNKSDLSEQRTIKIEEVNKFAKEHNLP